MNNKAKKELITYCVKDVYDTYDAIKYSEEIKSSKKPKFSQKVNSIFLKLKAWFYDFIGL